MAVAVVSLEADELSNIATALERYLEDLNDVPFDEDDREIIESCEEALSKILGAAYQLLGEGWR